MAAKPRLTKREKVAVIAAICATTCGEDPWEDDGKTMEAAINAEHKLKQIWRGVLLEQIAKEGE